MKISDEFTEINRQWSEVYILLKPFSKANIIHGLINLFSFIRHIGTPKICMVIGDWF